MLWGRYNMRRMEFNINPCVNTIEVLLTSDDKSLIYAVTSRYNVNDFMGFLKHVKLRFEDGSIDLREAATFVIDNIL